MHGVLNPKVTRTAAFIDGVTMPEGKEVFWGQTRDATFGREVTPQGTPA